MRKSLPGTYGIHITLGSKENLRRSAGMHLLMHQPVAVGFVV
jgi:hypothetical protein